MRKLIPAIALSVVVFAICMTQSCVKSIADGYTEPITIIQPDTLITAYVKSGSVYPIEIQFETDRPIIWAKCMFEIDSPGSAGLGTYHTYPDTQFYATPSPPYNKYHYKGSFTVPVGLSYQDTIRFDVKMKGANNPSSPDFVMYDKQFNMILQ